MSYRFKSISISLLLMFFLAGCLNSPTPTVSIPPFEASQTISPAQVADLFTHTPTPAPGQPTPAPSATSPAAPTASPTLTAAITPTGVLMRATFVFPPTATPQPGLPADCAALPGPVMVNRQDQFCFSYPENFTLAQNERQQTLITGRALDSTPGALRASLVIEISSAPAGKSLSQLVDDFLRPFAGTNLPIGRTKIKLGNEPAELLEVVPGREGSRDVFVLRQGKFYRLIFMPSVRDYPKARGEVETLFRLATSTFTWLP